MTKQNLQPEKEFKKYFPDSNVDKKLFSFVGTQPEMNLKKEKRTILDAIWKKHSIYNKK